jgi:hypothetical protein
VVARYVPEILAEVPCTAFVVTVKLTVRALAGMVADIGTVATSMLLLLSETTAPEGGAAPFNVRVPVEGLPPVTVLGFKVRELKVATVAVMVVVLVTPA